MLKLLQTLNRWSPVSRPAEEKKTPTCGRCGYLDHQLGGWFKEETGELLEDFPIGPEDTVIDVGCGNGGAVKFAARCGASVKGIDVDPDTIAQLKKRVKPARGGRFEAILSDSDPLPIPDASASRVICMEVLEHVEEPAQLMSELVRVGKPGALYLITVPDTVAEEVQRTLAPPAYWSKPNHLRIFGREAFGQLIEDAGLKIEKRARFGFYWSMWWILFWAADQEFGEPETPLLRHWTKTWHTLITSPNGEQVRKALNEFMPKNQVVIARKAA